MVKFVVVSLMVLAGCKSLPKADCEAPTYLVPNLTTGEISEVDGKTLPPRMIEFTQVLGLACPFYTEGVGKCVKAIFVAPDHFRVMCGPEKTKE